MRSAFMKFGALVFVVYEEDTVASVAEAVVGG
jgi:hypothetical protein